MLLNLVITCVVLQTLAIIYIAINSVRIAICTYNLSEAISNFAEKVQPINLNDIPDMDEDYVSGLMPDDEETKQ